jgi:glycosyltransferase involved in cell wall biosynthesis
VSKLAGADVDALGIGFLDASDRNRPFGIGLHDTFLATAWWTAHPARSMARFTKSERILYLIQDFEPLFYGASENWAEAGATYDFDHVPIINTSLLRDHLVANRIGRFENSEFGRAALVFEPAVDRSLFKPSRGAPTRPRRLLFYARPLSAKRNLFGLGVAALRAAVRSGVFRDGAWEFIGMGDGFQQIPLGGNAVLRPTSWLDFAGYAEQMSKADILLSLMLSPHPSYPPLEIAACGGTAVTTEYGVKTAARLRELSPDIIGVPPRIDALQLALTHAVSRSDAKRQSERTAFLEMPRDWNESFSDLLPKLVDVLRASGCVEDRGSINLPAPESFPRVSIETPGAPRFYAERFSRRQTQYRGGSSDNLFSLVTTVYNTAGRYIFDLANSVFGQDSELAYEWVILDNGSSDAETLQALEQIRRHPNVRLERVEDNIGIVGGMRWCLENARNRYILPLDSDDLLFPDCLRVMTSFLEQTGFPLIIYTDEDKTEGDNHVWPYIKPDWDPVLFLHSCYIAHFTAIDRLEALSLGCYTDRAAEGCHDWDTFMRFLLAGAQPVHLPEILYTWRMHPGSTAGNYRSKPYIYDSHRFVLERFLSSKGIGDKYELTLAPLFGGTPDYRFAARTSARRTIVDFELPEIITRQGLATFLASVGAHVELILLRDPLCRDIGASAIEEAEFLLDAFPDTAMVGGRIHDGEVVVEAGYVFDYAGPIGCPDVGRTLNDPGYFAQMWKPRSVAAVSARLAIVTMPFLCEFAKTMPDLSPRTMGLWLGAFARQCGRRVTYTPYVEALIETAPISMTEQEMLDFHEKFGGLRGDLRGYSPHLDLTGTSPYQPGLTEPSVTLPPFHLSLSSHIASRQTKQPPLTGNSPTTSIITTVYERTDPVVFALTAESVRGQTHGPHEWLILAHGPISDELDRKLANLQLVQSIRVLRLEDNLGIQGGLRYCIERASGDFVISLDADDLLTPDAVAIMTRAAVENRSTAIFYSDEDLLIDGVPKHPFYRGAFDPILLFSHSSIWHLIFFNRRIGLEIGAYTSREAEYAQDWDTMLRFHSAGHNPVHVGEIVYHWRQHESSLSNSGSVFAGSARSVRALLDRIRLQSGRAQDLQVAVYPADLGAPSWYLRRKPVALPPIDLIRLISPAAAEDAPCSVSSFTSVGAVPILRGPLGIARLSSKLATGGSPFVLLLGGAVAAFDEDGLWQAIKHLELVPSCMAVGGVIATRGGRILWGAPVQVQPDRLDDPLRGATIRDPGPFSMALLPHCISAVTPDLMVARRDWLVGVLRAAPRELGLRSLAAWLGASAQQAGNLLGFEPLMRAYIDRSSDLAGDDIEGLNRALASHIRFESEGPTMQLRGLGAHLRHATMLC